MSTITSSENPSEKRPFILGFRPSIPDSAFLQTDKLYERVGNNTGNLAFHFAIDRHLGGDAHVVDWSAPIEQINSGGRVGILPCANQLGPHADYSAFATKFKNLSVPLVAIGLGAQAGTDAKVPDVPPGTLDWVRAIADHAPEDAPNITVRGQFTLEVLAHYGLADRAVVLGCPTLFINPDPALGHLIASNVKEPKRIAVASGHQRWKHLAAIEASLARMVTATSGSYVGQSPLEMLKLTRGEAEMLNFEQLMECRRYACPEMDSAEFVWWSKRHGNVFFDIPSWMEHYRRFDFVVGARIHGVMLGLQAGVPSLCIVHDSRTLELCQTMAVPYVLAKDVVRDGISRESLLKLFHFDADAFDQNRRKLCTTYLAFLERNGIRPAGWLKNIGDPGSG